MWHTARSSVFAPAIPLGSDVPGTPTVAEVRGLSGGTLGVAETLRHMREFVRASLREGNQRVRETALYLVSNCPERHWRGEIVACHGFVRDRIRYVLDPDDMELVQTPAKTLDYGQGDCDDKATLLAALLKAIGHPCRFVAVGIGGGPFSHVLVETKIRSTGHDLRDWLPLETILQVPPGWYPPDATSRYVLKV